MEQHFIDEISENITKLYQDNILTNKYIVLFGANLPSAKSIHFLSALGYTVSAIVDNNPKYHEQQISGVPIYRPEECLNPYRNDALILVASRHFESMKEQLIKLGYSSSQIICTCAFQKRQATENSFNCSIEKTYIGLSVYNDIVRKFSANYHILVCPYPANGDIFFVCSYLKAYCKKHSITEYVLIVPNNACKKIASMFAISPILLFDSYKISALTTFALMTGFENSKIKIFNHRAIHYDVLQKSALLDKLDWGTVFLDVLMKVSKKDKSLPQFADEKDVEQIIKENGIVSGKSIILSPYANSIIYLNKGLWNKIVDICIQKGYTLYTNSSGDNEPPLPHTKAIFFPFNAAQQIIETCGCFIGLRSGLCDIISDSDAKVIVLFPSIGTQAFFAFKPMGFGENIIDFCCDEETLILDYLQNNL